MKRSKQFFFYWCNWIPLRDQIYLHRIILEGGDEGWTTEGAHIVNRALVEQVQIHPSEGESVREKGRERKRERTMDWRGNSHSQPCISKPKSLFIHSKERVWEKKGERKRERKRESSMDYRRWSSHSQPCITQPSHHSTIRRREKGREKERENDGMTRELK